MDKTRIRSPITQVRCMIYFGGTLSFLGKASTGRTGTITIRDAIGMTLPYMIFGKYGIQPCSQTSLWTSPTMEPIKNKQIGKPSLRNKDPRNQMREKYM